MSQQRICDGCNRPIAEGRPYLDIEHRNYRVVLGDTRPVLPGDLDLHDEACALLYFARIMLLQPRPLSADLRTSLENVLAQEAPAS